MYLNLSDYILGSQFDFSCSTFLMLHTFLYSLLYILDYVFLSLWKALCILCFISTIIIININKPITAYPRPPDLKLNASFLLSALYKDTHDMNLWR